MQYHIANLPLEIMEALYTCFIRVENHQQCISNASELRRELETDDSESNALAIKLAGVILNSSLNTSNYVI